MCKQLAGLNCLPMAFGLLKVRDHPEVLSRDGVKQLYFEVLSLKHLKHSHVCACVYRLVEIYLSDISVCY